MKFSISRYKMYYILCIISTKKGWKAGKLESQKARKPESWKASGKLERKERKPKPRRKHQKLETRERPYIVHKVANSHVFLIKNLFFILMSF